MAAVDDHRRWLQRRKDILEEHFPYICTCYIFKPFARQGSCKNCQMCPGCELHVKNRCWDEHAKSCRALKETDDAYRRQRSTAPPG